MSPAAPPDLATASDQVAAAWLCAVDPAGLGGVVVRARAGPARDRWIALLRALLPPGTPVRRLPVHADEARIFGGLDLAATLAAGRPVAERGVLADTDGGLLILSMAERVTAAMAARLGTVLDTGTVLLERDGLASRRPARIGLVALDEGVEADERTAAALRDRLAFHIDLDGVEAADPAFDGVEAARAAYPSVTVSEAILQRLCEAAIALGVDSLRAGVFAVRAARAAAALGGRPVVADVDAALAARLVLAPRATRLPVEAPADPQADDDPPDGAEGENQGADTQNDGAAPDAGPDKPADDMVLAAAKAAIPPGLLDRLQADALARAGRQAQGRSGALQASTKRGRPAGLRQGMPGGGARLNVIATLRAAAPWQAIRARPAGETSMAPARRIEIRRDDLRITRFKQRTETTTIFVVDASGSLAVNRLAEAKGAVELLLADCYVRRDQVALLAFRGKGAELLLPPTRSLTRARRCLSDLPGGGSTPLASAIEAAVAMADAIRRRGQTPVVVFMTDGRANVARDGTTGRGQGDQDAHAAAKSAGQTGIRMLLVDTAQRPQASAQALAQSLGALYIPLPRVDAGALSRAVLAAT